MIRREDLESDERLHQLYRGAVAQGFINRSEDQRLMYFAAAEQALDESEDPGALFQWIVTNKAWDKISDCAEDRAQERVKRIFDGIEVRGRGAGPSDHEQIDQAYDLVEEKIRAWKAEQKRNKEGS